MCSATGDAFGADAGYTHLLHLPQAEKAVGVTSAVLLLPVVMLCDGGSGWRQSAHASRGGRERASGVRRHTCTGASVLLPPKRILL